jgi:putative serine protease PepD
MRVYREVSPAVVNIVTRSLTFNFWMQAVPQTGQGTGFTLDEKGHILTNNHVIGNAEDLEVTFAGGKKTKAQLVGQDPVSDLAVIKVEPFKGMSVATLGSSDNLSVGQRVIAIGNPFGFQNTVTAGFISALDRDILIGDRTIMGLIQTDAAINPGNSGGPLINAAGDVIGVNSAIYTRSGGSIGIGLAMPIDRAKKVAAQIIRWGRAIYPWLGIKSAMNLTPELASQMGLAPVEGVLIFEVAGGSPAAEAGLRGGTKVAYYRMRPILLGGDVILSVGGIRTPTWDDYRNALFERDIGEDVHVEALRGKEKIEMDMKLAPDPRVVR